MSTAYTIYVINQSGATKDYTLFIQPPGSTTPIYDNAWVVFESITDAAFDSVIFAPQPAVQAEGAGAPPVPGVLVVDGACTPGEAFTPVKGASFTIIDFSGRLETIATATESPDGFGFSVVYS
jgi:hypothetical protein